MSIADHFERAPDAGFVRDYDSLSARRQFNVSMVMIVVVAVAATALGFLIRFDSPFHDTPSTYVSPPIPAYAGKL